MEIKDLKWLEPDIDAVKQLSVKASEALNEAPVKVEEKVEVSAAEPENGGSALSKMKNIVRKAVNCCIE